VFGATRGAPLPARVPPPPPAPAEPVDRYRAALSYLGTYAADRQAALRELLLEPARALPLARFAIGGSQYPHDFAWEPNINYLWHVPPYEHAAFFCSARLNLNITRAPMAAMGYCPSGRLFEAAACGAALITDAWPGLEEFYQADDEVLVAATRDDVLRALQRDEAELRAMAERARERTLAQHTIWHRGQQLVDILAEAHAGRREFEREPLQTSEI
jgi:spore maturation protein CgeB